MIAGYIIFRYKQPPKVSQVFNIGMWILSIFIMSMIIFGVWNGSLTLVATAFYVSLTHTGIAITDCLKCVVMNNFLSIFSLGFCFNLDNLVM